MINSLTLPELRSVLRPALAPWADRCGGLPIEDMLTDLVGALCESSTRVLVILGEANA